MASLNKITSEEAFAAAKLTLENGAGLVGDAQLLLAAGRFPRAITLAILAMEEFGKLPRFMNVDRYQRDGRMKVWWKYFRAHEVKSGVNALVSMQDFREAAERGELPDDWHLHVGAGLAGLKLRSLYVDFVDGAFVSPIDLPDLGEMAVWMVNEAEASLKAHQRHFAGLTPEKHAAMRDRVAAIADELIADPSKVEAYLEGREDESAAKLVRQTLPKARSNDSPH